MLSIQTPTPAHTPLPVPPIDFSAWAFALGTDEGELRGAVRIYGYHKAALLMGSPPLEALRSQARSASPILV